MSTAIGASNERVIRRAIFISVGAFLFAFCMIPFYNIYCQITGSNGKTGRWSENKASSVVVDSSREILVQFDASVRTGLSWSFAPQTLTMRVHPGQIYSTYYTASNLTDAPIVGNASPSVSPNKASIYFNKTECFCFTEQLLKAGETRQMPVKFVIDPDLPRNVTQLTLSYTFIRNDVATDKANQSLAPAPVVADNLARP
jgi:cytochrome c oxidase assembly protein subunit 11